MTKRDNDEFVDVKFDQIVRQTSKAFLVEVEGDETWVGKSQVDNATELEEEFEKPPHEQGSLDTIKVPRWLAVQNGWLDDE